MANGYNYLQTINDFTFTQLQKPLNNRFTEITSSRVFGGFRMELQHIAWGQWGNCNEMFANSVVALYHEVECPPRSPDLTHLEFLLWRYLKSHVFVTSRRDMRDRQNRIQVEFENLSQSPGVIHNAVKSMEKRARICIKKYCRYVEWNFAEAVPHRCLSKQLFCKYAADLLENNRAEVWF